MKKGFLEKTIPTVLAIIILMAGIGAGVYFFSKQQFFGFKAGPELSPQNVVITNVSDTGFTVSWVTQIPAVGLVRLGETEKVNKNVNDYRDQLTGENKEYITHYVNLDDLKPQTKYFFKVGSGSSRNLYDNLGQPYEVTIGPSLGTQPATDIIYGKVVNTTQKPVEGAVVYLSLANTAPLSALVGKDGMWAKPLHAARTQDLNSYTSYDAGTSVLTIKAAGGLSKKENATILVTTKNDTPVPTIVLGQDQDYRASAQEKPEDSVLPITPVSSIEPSGETKTLADQIPGASESPTPSPSESTEAPQTYFSSLSDLTATASASGSALLIINPKNNGEEINTLRPEILGQGPAGKVLTVKVESTPTYTGTVTIDEKGDWAYTPPADLTPGTHKVTATYVDENGATQSIARQFVVLAAEVSQLPAFEASASASSTPSAIPRISMPSTASGVPKSGVIGPTLMVLTGGFFFLVLGLWLQLSPRKKF